jgi:hypothetical protein
VSALRGLTPEWLDEVSVNKLSAENSLTTP